MRTKAVGGCIVTYPEQIVWLGDSNQINVSGSGAVGANIRIAHPNGIDERTLRYLSETNSITFTLDDSLLNLHDDNTGRYGVYMELFRNGVTDGYLSFTIQLLEGKSYTNRSHYVSRTIYVYEPDELNKIEVASPQNGTAVYGYDTAVLKAGLNSFNLSDYVTDYGEYSLCLRSDGGTGRPTITITGDRPLTPVSHQLFFAFEKGGSDGEETKGGDIYKKEDTVFPVCHRVIYTEHCADYDFMELRYIDADGCTRFIGGRILEETNSTEAEGYVRREAENPFRNIPRRHKTGSTRTVKLAFDDIRRDAYLQDILQSERVWFRNYAGEWWECAVVTDKLTVKNEEEADYQLDIAINEE